MAYITSSVGAIAVVSFCVCGLGVRGLGWVVIGLGWDVSDMGWVGSGV